eukprot:s460_g8.t1
MLALPTIGHSQPMTSREAAALSQFLNAPHPDSQLSQTISAIQQPSQSSVAKLGSSSLSNDLVLASDEEDVARRSDSEPDAVHQELFESSDDGTLAKRSANLSCLDDDDCDANWHASSDDGDLVMHSSGDSEDVEVRTSSTQKKGQKGLPAERRSAGSAQFLCKPVCWSALRRLLGVGDSTLQKMRRGENIYEGRPKRPKHPVFGFCMDDAAAKKWHGVVTFLWHTYHSCAEFMPNHLRAGLNKAESESRFPSGVEDTEAAEFVRRYVSKALMELHVYSSDVNVMHMGPHSENAPKRYLQHSSRTELYWEYTAYSVANDQEAASMSTFLRVTNKVLKPGMRGSALAFRKIGEHGQCDTCFELKLAIRKSKTEAEREANYSAYLKHVLSQWLDRQVYWHHRSQSHAYFQKLLTMGEKFLTS